MMDFIGSQNLHSISLCDLNTKFNDRCSTDWSKSNLISIVTPDGIYILKPQLDVQDGPFQVDLITNPTIEFHHTFNPRLWPPFDSIWHNLDSKQYSEVFSDPALMTNIDVLSPDHYPRRYRLAKWSEPLKRYPSECLLAVITLDNQLLVYDKRDQFWTVAADLSKDYDRIWSQLYTGQQSKEKYDYETIRCNLLSLSFCQVCWKESSSGDGPFLLAATIPGDIIIWQMILQELSYDSENSAGAFDVKLILHTEIKYITSMQLHNNLLFVSAKDGRVTLYDLTNSLNLFSDQSKSDQNEKTLSLVKLPPTSTIWHADNIEVMDMYIQPVSAESFRIVLAKSTNICWSLNSYTKRDDETVATLAIGSSFSAIDGLDPEVSLHQSPATWLRPAGQKRSILVADDGSFCQLEFIDDFQDTSPTLSAVKTGDVCLSHMIPRGLCSSPKGHLIIMISCVNFLYEPIKITAPSKLILIPSANDKKFFFESLNLLQDEKWLLENDVKSPMDVCDRIDYLRSIFHLLNYDQFRELYRILRDAIKSLGVPTNDTQLAKLKILGLIIMKLGQLGNSAMIEPDQQVDLDKDVRDIILQVEIERILSEFFEKHTLSGDKLIDNRQMNSIRNFFSWLEGDLQRVNIKQRFDDAFRKIELKSKGICLEICPICESEIKFVSLTYGTCVCDHRFDRCSRSLLVIDSRLDNDIICEHCKRHYNANLLWPVKNYWLCQYCQ